jgi:protein-disulfide isomerase
VSQERDSKILILPVSLHDHRRGTLSAAVTLVEYGDYACPQSGQAYTALKENWDRLSPRLCYVFRHFPLNATHTQAQHAAEATEVAGAQNKFWEMHDTLFTHQQALENGFLVEYAVALGMDTTRFLRDMSQHVYADRVREDLQSGMRSGVQSTPTFFINGVRHDKLWDIEALLAAVEEAADSANDSTASPQCGERQAL